MRLRHVTSSALIALSLSACPSEDGPVYNDPDGDMPADSAECPPSIPEFREGMTAAGRQGNIEAKLVSADKIPLGWYHNDWVVLFTNAETGEPVEDLEFGVVRPFMPVHNHDGNGQFPEIEEVAPGEYSFTGINITMNGPWDIEFNLKSASAGDDFVVFNVCNTQAEPE